MGLDGGGGEETVGLDRQIIGTTDAGRFYRWADVGATVPNS